MDKSDLEAIQAATMAGSAAGTRAAIADPETWRAGLAAMQEALSTAAQKESGRWIMGWFGWMLRKAAGAAVIIGVLYYTGGLGAVVAYLKVKP